MKTMVHIISSKIFSEGDDFPLIPVITLSIIIIFIQLSQGYDKIKYDVTV